jgi:anaerobic selenocysteine-containing dehydrogenase
MSSAAAHDATELKVIQGACSHDCPDTCIWQVTVKDGVATKLAGDPDHPFTRGGLCAKVNHYLERVYDPKRVLYPLRRTGRKGEGKFERASWDEALTDITYRLKQIVDQFGPTAIIPYSYAGNEGIIQYFAGHRFFNKLGATRLERSLCGDTAGAGIAATQGNEIGIDPEDIRYSRFIILWGTNTIVTNLHLWPFIRKAKEQGAKVVVIDPLKTRTAESADWHIRPMPGTDAALALGMMHIIVKENLYDREYVSQHAIGFEELRARLAEYAPDRVAALTGVATEDIIRLAREYASVKPSLIRLLIGLEHNRNGAMMFRTISCLPVLTGAWRDCGGGLTRSCHAVTLAALNLKELTRSDLEDKSIRLVNMAQIGTALTSPSMSPPIKAMIVWGCNPAVIAPNQQLVLRGLQRDDLFLVVHELFLTDTARYADYVLPATSQIEHLDIVASWGHFYLPLNEPAINPLGEAVSNTEFFRRLSKYMGFKDEYLFESDEKLIEIALASDDPVLRGVTLERLKKESWVRLNVPNGWRPFADGGFPTPSGKAEFYSTSLERRGLDPLPTHTSRPITVDGNGKRKYPLMLITGKSLHFLNSSYAHSSRHTKAEGEPMLEIHPSDARKRSLSSQDRVRVFNERGEVTLRCFVSDRTREGVVAIPFGWWASFSQDRRSANSLTTDELSDWGGTGALYDTYVEVEREQQSELHAAQA